MLDAKEYLLQVKKLDLLIRNRLVEQQQWKDIALCITASPACDRVQTSGSKTKTADAIDKYVAMEAEIDRAVDKLVATKKEVIETIEKLDSIFQMDVLFKCYIQGLSFQEIADSCGKSYDCIKQLHKRALRNLQAILDQK